MCAAAALPKRKKPLALFPIVCYGADVIKIVYLKRKTGNVFFGAHGD